jgi:hypothetical protein
LKTLKFVLKVSLQYSFYLSALMEVYQWCRTEYQAISK